MLLYLQIYSVDRAAASDGHIVSTETPRLVERKRRETRRWKNKCHGRSVVASFLIRAAHAKAAAAAARHGTRRFSHSINTHTNMQAPFSISFADLPPSLEYKAKPCCIDVASKNVNNIHRKNGEKKDKLEGGKVFFLLISKKRMNDSYMNGIQGSSSKYFENRNLLSLCLCSILLHHDEGERIYILYSSSFALSSFLFISTARHLSQFPRLDYMYPTLNHIVFIYSKCFQNKREKLLAYKCINIGNVK